MANQFITTSLVLQESLQILKNTLQFARYVSRMYDPQFAVAGAKVGATVNARKPPKYMGGYGNGLHLEDIAETPVPITVDQLFGVHLTFTDVDLTLSMDRFRARYLDAAVARIANEIDRVGLQTMYQSVYNAVGTPATVPATSSVYLSAGVALDNTGTPRRGRNTRSAVIGSQMQATIVAALQGLFQSAEKIREQYEDGEMGYSLGLNFSMDQNVATHTVGAFAGTPLVNAASQTGASLITDGWTGATGLKKGDIFTIGSGATSIYGVKPQTGSTDGAVSTGVLQQFVVTADSDPSGGAITIPISPSIIPGGAFQTVTGSPADNAAINVLGAASAVSPTGLAFHRDFATLVTVDLEAVRGVDMMGRINDDDLGIAMRLVRAYDINTNSGLSPPQSNQRYTSTDFSASLFHV